MSVQFIVFQIYSFVSQFLYLHTHIFTHTHTHANIHTHIYIYMYFYIYTHRHTFRYTHIYTQTYAHIYLHIFTYTYIYTNQIRMKVLSLTKKSSKEKNKIKCLVILGQQRYKEVVKDFQPDTFPKIWPNISVCFWISFGLGQQLFSTYIHIQIQKLLTL